MLPVTELHFELVNPENPDLRRLISILDEDLKQRYPHEMIYVVDFDDPKVKEMTFVVAFLNGNPVGCGGLRPLDYISTELAAMELKRFYVDTSYRKMGIAAKMLLFLEDQAMSAGYREIRLETGIKQPEAIALYVKYGYEPIELFGPYIGDPDSLCYGKKLNGGINMSINVKQLAAEKAVEYVKDGMKIGLGTGSTAYWAIRKLGERVNEGLKITAVATSQASEDQARELGIPIVAFGEIDSLDLTIDGADELDSQLQLIKGGGGALLREKIVASNSTRMIVVADESKVVDTLGKFPLPVEIIPFAWEWTVAELTKLGCVPNLRRAENELYKTDNGNYIADCDFEAIKSAPELALTLQNIPGVVDHGLFIGIAALAIVGKSDGSIEMIEVKRKS